MADTLQNKLLELKGIDSNEEGQQLIDILELLISGIQELSEKVDTMQTDINNLK